MAAHLPEVEELIATRNAIGGKRYRASKPAQQAITHLCALFDQLVPYTAPQPFQRVVAADERGLLLPALVRLTELCEHVPVFQLDNGKSSVKAVRLAGTFVGALDEAKAAIAKTLHPSYKLGEIGPHGLVPATREEIEKHTDRVKRDVVPKIMEEQRRKRGGKP